MRSQIRIIMESVFNDLTERFGDTLEYDALPESLITDYKNGLRKTIIKALKENNHREEYRLHEAVFSAVYAWVIGGMKAHQVSPRNRGSVLIQEIFRAGMEYQRKIDARIKAEPQGAAIKASQQKEKQKQ